MVADETLNQRVPGSSPGAPTKKVKLCNKLLGRTIVVPCKSIVADPMRTPATAKSTFARSVAKNNRGSFGMPWRRLRRRHR